MAISINDRQLITQFITNTQNLNVNLPTNGGGCANLVRGIIEQATGKRISVNPFGASLESMIQKINTYHDLAKCNNGDIILRKSKKGKAFYGCSNYPECDFLSWNKPTGDMCDKCGSYMVEKITRSETKVVCPNKECKNEMVKENSEN